MQTEHIVDLNHAIAELEAARAEISMLPPATTRRARRWAMEEPLARIGLVRRFCDSLLERYGVKVEVIEDAS